MATLLFVGAAVVAGVVVGVTRGRPPATSGGAPAPVQWVELSLGTSPPPLEGASIAYDGATHQLLVFGGEEAGGAVQSVTWEWTGTAWKALYPKTSPPALVDASMAYDPATGQVVLFGGLTGQAVPGSLPVSGETWGWTGTNWKSLSPLSSPSARSNAVMAFDDATGQLVLYGGSDRNGFAQDDTWGWTGITWQRFAASEPGALAGAAMAYDPATHQLVLVGGTSAHGATFTVTWSWSGTSWRRLSPPASPPARTSPSLAYDPAAGGLVLFGGLGPATGIAKAQVQLSDTWKWSGTTWSKLEVVNPPAGRSGAVMAFDPGTGRLVLFGGASGTPVPLDDTWELAPK